MKKNIVMFLVYILVGIVVIGCEKNTQSQDVVKSSHSNGYMLSKHTELDRAGDTRGVFEYVT